jgi:hypothetical protein
MWIKAEDGTLINVATVSLIQIKGARAENDYRGDFVKFRIVTKVDTDEITLMTCSTEEEAKRQMEYLGQAMEVLNWP